MKSTNGICEQCAGVVPAGAVRQLCPQCLLRLAETDPAQTESTPATVLDAASGSQPISNATSSIEFPGQRLGRYRLLEPIGEGGFGVVWMAEQEEPVRRRVALKILKPGMDTREVVARFEAERQALAMMDHPNIARVFDGGATESGRPYFVMELFRGVPLTTYCDTAKLDTGERLRLFIDICHAVQHAHQKGIIHRDLKPTNVLVAVEDNRSIAKVIDFGIAKATEQSLTDKTLFTRVNQTIGTPAYMSPEQAGRGNLDIDTRSDIYSLGVMLYELLTGHTPFLRDDLRSAGLEEVLRLVREEEPPRPSTRLSSLRQDELFEVAQRRRVESASLHRLVRGELDWIVMKAMEKDRNRRYETAIGLARDLERFLNHEPVSAVAPGFGYRFSKFAQRNRITIATAAAFVAMLVAATILSVGLALRASRSADRERVQRIEALQARQEAERHQRRAETNFTAARRNLYFADMSLAGQALLSSHLGRARSLLERYRPEPGSPDLRGWEWSFLASECRDQSEFSLPHSKDSIRGLAFLPDDRHVVVGSPLGAMLWKLPEGTIEARYSNVLTGGIAVSADGRLGAFAQSGSVLIRGLPQGDVQSELFLAPRAELGPSPPVAYDMAFSPDGRLLAATVGRGGPVVELVLFDWRARQVVSAWETRDLAASHGSRVVFSPDGGHLVLGISGGSLLHIRVDTGKLEKRLYLHEENITALAFSPDGSRLAVGSGYSDTLIRVFALTNDWRPSIFRGHRGWVKCLAFLPDGRRLVSGSADQTVSVWDVETGARERTLRGMSDEVYTLGLSHDGRQLLAGSKSGEIKGWSLDRTLTNLESGVSLFYPELSLSRDLNRFAGIDLAGRRQVVYGVVAAGPPAPIAALGETNSAVAISPEGDWVVAAGMGGSLRSWHAGDGRAFEHLPVDGTNFWVALESHDDSSGWLTIDSARMVRRWTRELKLLGEFRLPDSIGALQRGSIVRGGRFLLGPLVSDPGVGVLDTASGRLVAVLPHNGILADSEISPDGRTLLVGAESGRLSLYDIATWELKASVARSDLLAVNSVAFTPDGKRFLSGGGSGSIRVWDLASQQEICVLPTDAKRSWVLRVSPDGRRVAYGLQAAEGIRVRLLDPGMPPEAPSPMGDQEKEFRMKGRLMADEFEGSGGLSWEIRHPSVASPAGRSERPGHWTIHTQPGGFFGNSTNFHDLCLVSMRGFELTNFAVVTKLTDFQPREPFQQAGLLLWLDHNNYLKLTVEPALPDTPERKREPDEFRSLAVVREMHGSPVFERRPLGGGTGPVWLRIMRVGAGYECSFSLDGERWTTCIVLPWEFYGPAFAGLVAKNGDGGSSASIPAAFDYFEVRQVEMQWHPAPEAGAGQKP